MGEVVVKGPMIMLGYSNNEEANQKTFDSEGWTRRVKRNTFGEKLFSNTLIRFL